MFEQYGLIEARDPTEMIETAGAFLAFGSRLPAGKRVGICTSSGGGGAWAADACVAAGLDGPMLDAETRALLDARLPAYGTSQNPVDVTAQGGHQHVHHHQDGDLGLVRQCEGHRHRHVRRLLALQLRRHLDDPGRQRRR